MRARCHPSREREWEQSKKNLLMKSYIHNNIGKMILYVNNNDVDVIT